MDTELKKLRETANVSQQEIADYAGITPKSYRRYEQGKAYPTVDVAIRLAKYYNLLVENIFDEGRTASNTNL